MLHHDGRWTHEGVPLLNRRLREAFDRSVRYLPDEHHVDADGGAAVAGKYVVQLGHFRGEIEVEEAGFFVSEVDLASGGVRLSDRSWDRLEVARLEASPRDGALLCSVKRDLVPGGLRARFSHAAQAELLDAVRETRGRYVVRVAGSDEELPEL